MNNNNIKFKIGKELLLNFPFSLNKWFYLGIGFLFVSINIQAQCTLSCRPAINVSLDFNGQSIIPVSAIFLGDATNCPDLVVEIFDLNNQNLGNTVSCDQVGLTLDARLKDTLTNNYCISQITIADYYPPTIQVVDTFLSCNLPRNPENIGYPVVFDNCSDLDASNLVYYDETEDLACFTSVNGHVITFKTTRNWSVQDDMGNNASAIQYIYSLQLVNSDITFPPNKDGVQSPLLECAIDDYLDLNVTGQPTVANIPYNNQGICDLSITYSDQIFGSCGNSQRVLREWTAFNWCTNNSISQLQIIKIEDHIAPTFDCPDDITINTSNSGCQADITFDSLQNINDNCSETTEGISWQFGNGFGPFTDVPKGTYAVNYFVTDACGNTEVCTKYITIEDQNVPIAICNDGINVGISNSGMIRIYPNDIDGGSSDNCAIYEMKISTETSGFGDYVELNCDDIQSNPIDLMLRVIDNSGLVNVCQSTVNIFDYYKPELICPTDITINCQENYQDLNLTGICQFADNCSLDTTYFIDEYFEGACSNGYYKRKWIAIDFFDNKDSCIQQINFIDTANLNIIFPNDTTISTCLDFFNTENTGSPLITGGACKLVTSDFEDEFINIENGCNKILRTWTVINWCVFDPNQSQYGKFSSTQMIQLENSQAPLFVPVQDTIIEVYVNNCDPVQVNIPDFKVVSCDSLVTFSNNSDFATNSKENISGLYPFGKHEITIEAKDGCGNTSSMVYNIEILDAKSPTLNITNYLNFQIPENGYLEIDESTIDLGSYDNCSNELIWSIIPNHFSCADVGSQTINVVLTDSSGNSTAGSILLDLYGNDNCYVSVSGKLENSNGVAISGAKVRIEGDFDFETTTDFFGNYYFHFVPQNGIYEVIPELDKKPMNGISPLDVVLLIKTILAIESFESADQLLKADVDNSKSIDIIDVIILRQLILGIISELPGNPSWSFYPESFDLPSLQNILQTVIPHSEMINVTNENMNNINFIGLKSGDLNDSSNPNNL